MANLIKFGQGTFASYDALASKSQYEVYFCTDTHQIFVGAEEYTKSAKTLGAVPTTSTAGDVGRLYFSSTDNALYLCTAKDGSTYTWLRVANINDLPGTVTSVAAGDGLETADGEAITSTGTIKHSVPSGASTYADDVIDQTPAFGSTFAIESISSDKFGHVTAINKHTVTIPTETTVSTAAGTTAEQTLSEGGSFTVLTGLSASDHEVSLNTTTFTLPSDLELTYEISSTEEGVVTLTDSEGGASTAQINGWDLLAKKSDITTVFRYKGSVATPSDLPQTAGVEVGDVYQVANGPQGANCEYVCVDNTTPGSFTWEELGTTVDLSAYATTAYVEDLMSWHTF